MPTEASSPDKKSPADTKIEPRADTQADTRAKKAAPAEPRIVPGKIERKPARIYLGPNLPGALLTSGTIFRGGDSPQVTEAMSRWPQVERLLVPLEEAPAAKRNLADPASRLSRARHELLFALEQAMEAAKAARKGGGR